MASIVGACQAGALRTHVMYRCSLNSSQLTAYMTFLLKSGLIERRKDEQASRYIYRTSEQGRRFLDQYERLSEILFPERDTSSQKRL
jgi:predicted transcriptional regulator